MPPYYGTSRYCKLEYVLQETLVVKMARIEKSSMLSEPPPGCLLCLGWRWALLKNPWLVPVMGKRPKLKTMLHNKFTPSNATQCRTLRKIWNALKPLFQPPLRPVPGSEWSKIALNYWSIGGRFCQTRSFFTSFFYLLHRNCGVVLIIYYIVVPITSVDVVCRIYYIRIIGSVPSRL